MGPVKPTEESSNRLYVSILFPTRTEYQTFHAQNLARGFPPTAALIADCLPCSNRTGLFYADPGHDQLRRSRHLVGLNVCRAANPFHNLNNLVRQLFNSVSRRHKS